MSFQSYKEIEDEVYSVTLIPGGVSAFCSKHAVSKKSDGLVLGWFHHGQHKFYPASSADPENPDSVSIELMKFLIKLSDHFVAYYKENF